jgi:hypothetical protein
MKLLLFAYPPKSHLMSCVTCAIYIKNTHRIRPQSIYELTDIIALGKVSSKQDGMFFILFLRQGFMYDSFSFWERRS